MEKEIFKGAHSKIPRICLIGGLDLMDSLVVCNVIAAAVTYKSLTCNSQQKIGLDQKVPLISLSSYSPTALSLREWSALCMISKSYQPILLASLVSIVKHYLLSRDHRRDLMTAQQTSLDVLEAK